MAAADTAKLVAQLTLDDRGFSKGVKNANRSIGALEGTVGNVGKKASAGLKSFGRNVGLIGVAAAGGIALMVKGGLDSLAQLETAITSVDGAIQQLGLTGQVTGDQVAKWANDIERDVGAAFDDKEITAAAATLLRFGKVTPKNLEQALVVMTDLAAKTGDVESASNLLAKALADPAKAAGKLAKAGVVLTKAQQDTIKAMVKQNDLAGAQKFILDELAKTTGGAALASQGKYARSIALLNDVVEDAQKALAVGFLPVIEKVADKLSKALADPATLRNIEAFGTKLAGGLDKALSIAEKIPWETIGKGLETAAFFAEKLFDAFIALPPEVQTTIIALAGLNKLSGGAITGIVSELGKGLIKGVLGINAGVVNINAATVSGGGGVPGAGGKGGAGVLGKVASAILPVAIVSIGAAAALELSGLLDPKHQTPGGRLFRGTNVPSEQLQHLINSLPNLRERAAGGDTFAAKQLEAVEAEIARLTGEVKTGLGGLSQDERDQKRVQEKALAAVHNSSVQDKAIATRNQEAAFKVRDAVNTKVGLLSTITGNVKSAIDATKAAAAHAGQQTAAAIKDKDLSVKLYNSVTVSTSVSVRSNITAHNNYKSVYRVAS